MPLVFAAIAPHGSMAIAEWCKPEERGLAAKTRAAMEDLGRRFSAVAPEVTVVLKSADGDALAAATAWVESALADHPAR